MLKIQIPEQDFFNEKTNEFESSPGWNLELEHSLAALSRWESIWEKPFLTDKPKTREETQSYIQCMTLNKDVPVEVYSRLTEKHYMEIRDYIDAKMTATWFAEVPGTSKKPASKKIITSEIFYYWMVTLQIPFECQYWHLSRLFTLIRVCSEQNAPKKKMSKSELASRNRALNEARKAQLNTTG